jgi:hypothetical protein
MEKEIRLYKFIPSSGANAADANFDISIRKGFTGFRIKQTLG